MTDDRVKGTNTRKDPDEWTTGDEPMTGAQASYLKTLSEEADETFDEGLTKAQASKRIDDLQRKTGRGRPAQSESRQSARRDRASQGSEPVEGGSRD